MPAVLTQCFYHWIHGFVLDWGVEEVLGERVRQEGTEVVFRTKDSHFFLKTFKWNNSTLISTQTPLHFWMVRGMGIIAPIL